MKKKLVNVIAKRCTRLCAVAGLLLCALPAAAQNVPIIVDAKQAIKDQWGVPLSRANGGDLVQILFVNGQIYPPNMDGTPHTNNPIAYEARIGHGLVDHETTKGRFNAAITERSEAQIFARVWNTPSLANASYYGDSQIFTPDKGKVFVPVIEATTNALDYGDDDNDGLNNSMEADLGSNKNNADSDGDTVLDYAEFRAGTELTNDLSYLAMVEILPHTNDADVVQVQWSAVDGKSYQLQYATDDLTSTNLSFLNVNSVVTATGDTAYTFVTNSLFENIRNFRVLLVE